MNATGGVFIADVNHLKSKGSACASRTPATARATATPSRTVAAECSPTWLATDPTGTGEQDVLILGDLNSYAKEDPIRPSQDAGLHQPRRAVPRRDAYSYVFDGQWGYLDHALGSADHGRPGHRRRRVPHQRRRAAGLDYNIDFKTPGLQSSAVRPDEFRVSDHDPVSSG